MPRGLGDDPLSRGRKAKRAAKSPDVVAASAGSAPEAPISAPGPASSSYNDVFFQRRSEPAIEATVTAAPAAPAESEVAIATLPAAEPQAVTVQAVAPEPAVVAAVPPEPIVVEAPPVQAAPVVAVRSEQPAQEAPKGGFLSRIFGKLHK